MKQMAVELERQFFLPGEVVKGQVHLTIDKPVKARKIWLDVEGLEETSITDGAGKSSSTYYERNSMIENKILLHRPEGEEHTELEPGKYTFKFEFTIPKKALPSYRGRNAKITYSLNARVDVPKWLDIVEKKDFHVVRNRDDIRSYERPSHFQSDNYLNLEDDKPGFFVELPRIAFIAGKSIEGTITLCNKKACEVRKIELRLIGIEHAEASKYKVNQRLREYESELPTDNLVEATPARFHFPIPKSAPGSFEGNYSNFRWALEVQLDLPLKFDIKARYPVEIFR
jgi:hypothetical protein